MTRKFTQDEFVSKVKSLDVNDEYEVIGNYVNANTKVEFLHKTCGKTFMMRPVNFYRGQRCSHCNKNIKKTTHQFNKELIAKTDGEYEVAPGSKYINNKTKLSILHNKCGRTFEVTPVNILHGYGCSHCNKSIRKTTQQFNKEVEDMTNGEYTLHPYSEYKNNKTKIKIIHNHCGLDFDMRPNDFISGHRCPHCAILPHDSKGVVVIEEYLKDHSLEYTREFTFDDCKHVKVLPFDFMVMYNNMMYLIEFDGEQHFRPMEKLGGQKAFELTKKRDEIKNSYCEDKDIKLLRISYKEVDKICDILDNFFR